MGVWSTPSRRHFSDPLGTPLEALGHPTWATRGSKRGPRERQNASLFGLSWDPFGGSWPPHVGNRGVQERALEKEPQNGAHFGDFGVTFGTCLGLLWRLLAPQVRNKGVQGSHNMAPERAPKEDPQNASCWNPPGRGSGELSLRRKHDFHCFAGLNFGPHFGVF